MAHLTPGVTFAPGDRVVVVANPVTKGDITKILGVLEEIAPAGVELDVRVTQRAGHARELLAELGDDVRAVVAIGGDGTVTDAASALVDRDVPIGMVPAGSTNIIPRELGVPTRTLEAAKLIFGDHCVRTIDCGRVSDRDRVFLHMAGAGFDSRFFAMTSPEMKRRVGWLAYLPAAVKALRHPPAQFTVQIDDDEERSFVSPLVLVANGPSIITPGLRVHREIVKDDGLLDVLMITATRPRDLARVLGRFAVGQLEESPFVQHVQVRRVRVSAEPTMPVEFDGDVDGTTPFEVQVEPRSVQLIVPPQKG